MSTIAMRNLDEIYTNVQDILEMLLECKPYGMTADESIELMDDIQSRAKCIIHETEVSIKVTEHFNKQEEERDNVPTDNDQV